MSLVAFSPAPCGPSDELGEFERLAATLSSRFTHLHPGEIRPAIASALEQVARAGDVEACALLEFAEQGEINSVHVWPAGWTVLDPCNAQSRLPITFRERLLRNEVVTIAQSEGWLRSPAQALRSSGSLGLGVPVVVADQVVCALVVWGRRSVCRWTEPFTVRMRLIADIFGLVVLRCRHENALRASRSTIEQLSVRLAADNAYLQEEIKTRHEFDEIVGESAALGLALNRLGHVAPMNASVLLLGETGTGKELFARALHDRGPRQKRPLIRVNCAALPPTLIESELFGHERGAFTGAVSLRQGRFELADGGTIFLDEIGDLPLELQAKLLRVVQEGDFERVGSSHTRHVDVRIITATHRNLEADVAAGRFRADLFYRLSVFPIHLPALRERQDDIPALVCFFIDRHQRDLNRRITHVPQAVMRALQQHTWPGNVRELENVIERAMIWSSGDTLQLDPDFGRHRGQLGDAPGPTSEKLDAIQRVHIEGILTDCDWRVNGHNNAAERLGVHPNTLRYRMRRLGIMCPPKPGKKRGRPVQSTVLMSS